MASPLEKLMILIAEDNKPMRSLVRDILEALGVGTILEAVDGTAAMKLLGTHAVDIVILDWNMEPMDGLALLTAVRARPEFKSLPFILVSADANPTLREKAVKLGVSLVLAKPFDAETLREAIAAL